MTDGQRNLSDWGATKSPPIVILDRNTETVRVPGEREKIAGHVGVAKNRSGRAYVARKERDEHYYRVGDGYAISDPIIRRLADYHVGPVIIHEYDTGDTLEFTLQQYMNGEDVEYAPADDPQTVVSEKDAKHIWRDCDPVVDMRGGD